MGSIPTASTNFTLARFAAARAGGREADETSSPRRSRSERRSIAHVSRGRGSSPRWRGRRRASRQRRVCRARSYGRSSWAESPWGCPTPHRAEICASCVRDPRVLSGHRFGLASDRRLGARALRQPDAHCGRGPARAKHPDRHRVSNRLVSTAGRRRHGAVRVGLDSEATGTSSAPAATGGAWAATGSAWAATGSARRPACGAEGAAAVIHGVPRNVPLDRRPGRGAPDRPSGECAATVSFQGATVVVSRSGGTATQAG